jgi:hypothetical protein
LYVPCNRNVLLNIEHRSASVEHVTNIEEIMAVYISCMTTGLEQLMVDSCTAAFIKDKNRIKISDRGR